MTDRSKFEQMLEHLVNEESDKAKELFHQLVVEKSREIYEEILSEDFNEAKEEDEEEMDEAAEDDEDMEEGIEDRLKDLDPKNPVNIPAYQRKAASGDSASAAKNTKESVETADILKLAGLK